MIQRKIRSWVQLQSQVEEILPRINADPMLALAAAANPIFALEELGYEIDSGVRREIEQRLRFGKRKTEQLRTLRQEVIRLAGMTFDLDSADELQRVLCDDLQIANLKQAQAQYAGSAGRRDALDTRPLPPQMPWTDKVEDPLERLRTEHPVMQPLLEYRRLEASRPRLAPRHLYEEIRHGKRRLPITGVRGRLKS